MSEPRPVRRRNLWKDERGQTMPFTVVCLFLLITVWGYTYNVGMMCADRIRLQNAVDNAAYSAATIQARMLATMAFNDDAIAWAYAKLLTFNQQVVVFGTQCNFAMMGIALGAKYGADQDVAKYASYNDFTQFFMVRDGDCPHLTTAGRLFFTNDPSDPQLRLVTPGNASDKKLVGEFVQRLTQGGPGSLGWIVAIPSLRCALGSLVWANQKLADSMSRAATATAIKVAYANVRARGRRLQDASFAASSMNDPNPVRLDPDAPFSYTDMATFQAKVEQYIGGQFPEYMQIPQGGLPDDLGHDPNPSKTFFYTVRCWSFMDWVHGLVENVHTGRDFKNSGSPPTSEQPVLGGAENNPATGHWHRGGLEGHHHKCRGDDGILSMGGKVPNPDGCKKCDLHPQLLGPPIHEEHHIGDGGGNYCSGHWNAPFGWKPNQTPDRSKHCPDPNKYQHYDLSDLHYHHQMRPCFLCNGPCLLNSSHEQHGSHLTQLSKVGGGYDEGSGMMVRLFWADCVDHFEDQGIEPLVEQQYWRAWTRNREQQQVTPREDPGQWLPFDLAEAMRGSGSGELPQAPTILPRPSDPGVVPLFMPVIVSGRATSTTPLFGGRLFSDTSIAAVAAASVTVPAMGERAQAFTAAAWAPRLVPVSKSYQTLGSPDMGQVLSWTTEEGNTPDYSPPAGQPQPGDLIQAAVAGGRLVH